MATPACFTGGTTVAEIRFVDKTLFGEWDAFPRSPGEYYIGKELLLTWDEMRSRAEWCMEDLPYTDNLLLEDEDHRLLRDCMSSYIFGLYAAAVISADAFLERIITDVVETHGKRPAKVGFGGTLATFGKLGLVDKAIFERLQHLHSVRNNLAHEKGPDHEMRIFRRALARRTRAEHLLDTDAKEAICLAYGLAGKLIRNFPRLALPGVGTPRIYRSHYKQ